MSDHYDVLIVGGGQGGAAAAMALRHNGFAGTIAIAGAEPELPYDRPPLSKDYLAGDKPFERMVFRSAEAWAERGVDLLLGRAVGAVDPEAREVTAAGRPIGYGQLIWAAGGRALTLDCPGHDLAGVHTIRSKKDVDRIIAELPRVERAVVIGGGYIGLEAAAVLTGLGKQVTLLEAKDRVLNRVAATPLSRFYEAEHRARGVDLRLGVRARCLRGSGRVEGVELSDGDALRADLVIVGIGIAAAADPLRKAGADYGNGVRVDGEVLPTNLVIVGIGIGAAADPLRKAGADYGNGVRVDGQCRTSIPGIFAVGDCAEHRNRFAGGNWVRLESVQNATDQAAVAAKTICGIEAEYTAVPWFWSNQYDLRLQSVGLNHGHDATVMRGDPAARSFSLVYLREGRVIALDCVNATRDYVQGRALVLAGTSPDAGALRDPSVPLKMLA